MTTLAATPGGRFDAQKFNIEFEKSKNIKKAQTKSLEQERLAKLSSDETTLSITELTVSEILIGLKDSWFDLLDDLLQRRFDITIFTKKNRLFYIGVTLIIIIIILYVYDLLSDETEKDNTRVVEVHHIYKIDNDISGNTVFKLAQASTADNTYINDLVRDVTALNSSEAEL
jgi:hypothetical protein